MSYLALEERNQFTFECPIFAVDTKMSSCVKLRNLYWIGKRPEQRKGCQACMSAGKCPVAEIVKRFSYSKSSRPVPDDYGSETPIKGKIRKDVLTRIQPILVSGRTLDQFGASVAEISKIETSNDRIAAMIGKAPESTTTARAYSRRTVQKEIAVKKPKSAKPQVQKAAETGDLTAAITAGDTIGG